VIDRQDDLRERTAQRARWIERRNYFAGASGVVLVGCFLLYSGIVDGLIQKTIAYTNTRWWVPMRISHSTTGYAFFAITLGLLSLGWGVLLFKKGLTIRTKL
jgi:hypothetical protein